MRAEWVADLADLICQASFCWRMYQRQCQLRAFETAYGPLEPEDISWWKLGLSADLVLVHIANPSSSCCRNSGLCQIGCHLCRTWIHWTSLSAHFADERPGNMPRQFDHQTSVHCCGMGPVSEEYIRKTCHSFQGRWQAVVAKKN